MANTIRAERATIEFCDGLSVDGYRMPNGEFRVGLNSASLIAGFAENYLFRLLDRKSGTRFKALQGTGFSQQTEKVVSETIRGDREAQTISKKDFVRFLRFADRLGNASAGAILDALAEISVDEFFRDGFAEKPLTIEEKRQVFYRAVSEKINWLEEDKNDRSDLVGWN